MTHGDPPPAHALITELLVADGAKILSPRLPQDVGGLGELHDQYGELVFTVIRSVLTQATIDCVPCRPALFAVCEHAPPVAH